jgi:hypothetical protein
MFAESIPPVPAPDAPPAPPSPSPVPPIPGPVASFVTDVARMIASVTQRESRIHLSRGESRARRAAQLIDDLFSVDTQIARCRDTKSHLITAHAKHGDRNITADTH